MAYEVKHKIEAIKVIRSLPIVIVPRFNDNGVTFNSIEIGIGLKEAKDLVESIMALSGDDYTISNLKNEIERLKAVNDELYKERQESRRKMYEILDSDYK